MSSCGIATGGTGTLLAASVGLSASEVVPSRFPVLMNSNASAVMDS
ncbi:hypothetical protein M126_1976 [Bacteroides fragilis str. S6L3]|nr:hypothetical protein M126_1976 [Bacteroides fragilis str. S6L3]